MCMPFYVCNVFVCICDSDMVRKYMCTCIYGYVLLCVITPVLVNKCMCLCVCACVSKYVFLLVYVYAGGGMVAQIA